MESINLLTCGFGFRRVEKEALLSLEASVAHLQGLGRRRPAHFVHILARSFLFLDPDA